MHRTLPLVCLVAGCFPPPAPPTTDPIREVRVTNGGAPRCLFVFLPGYGADPEDIVDRGFVEELGRYVDADATVVDAHLGYYLEQNILHRLEEDVIEPARANGYDKVWIVAISMGALGALGYGATHAEQLDGVVLLSPWMGLGFTPGGVEREIASSGGLRAWRGAIEDESELDGAAPMRSGTQDEFFRLIWAWAADPMRPDGSRVPVYVGYGRQDRWARAQSLLADAYPERQRLVAGGLHQWDVFHETWRGFLWSGFMQRSCGRARH